jgi:hypothetical protein
MNDHKPTKTGQMDSPKHPGNDVAMPPYTPGGVPAPEDGPAAGHRDKSDNPPPSGLPPKRAP